jgi:hypothetical protein
VGSAAELPLFMSIQNLPDDEKDIVNLAARAGYLKVETDIGEVKLNSYNQIEVQPKGTPFGAKIKVEEDGSITPTLTFDTKKLRDPKKQIDPKSIVDDALENFWGDGNV